MESSEEVFQYLLESLVDWRPKTTDGSVAGIGFNDKNVVDIMASLPNTTEFDFVTYLPPIIRQSAATTGSRSLQRITGTYTINVFTLRGGNGNNRKRATRAGMVEVVEFISQLFMKQGFIVNLAQADLEFLTDVSRQVITLTRTYIK